MPDKLTPPKCPKCQAEGLNCLLQITTSNILRLFTDGEEISLEYDPGYTWDENATLGSIWCPECGANWSPDAFEALVRGAKIG